MVTEMATSKKRGKRPPSEIDKVIGRRLRVVRRTAGMTMPELAKKLDVSYQQIQKYEAGENKMSIETLLKAADTFGRSLDYFIDRNAQYQPPGQGRIEPKKKRAGDVR